MTPASGSLAAAVAGQKRRGDELSGCIHLPICAARDCARQNSSKPFTIMYHGSLVERNGLDLAVNALEIVRNTIPCIELPIYGKRTPFLDRIMDRVSERGLTDCVR